MEELITNLHKLTDLQMFLDEIDREYCNRIAYRYFVNELIVDKTYSELTRDVKAIASWMVNKGYYGKHIAIVGSTSYHWVTTFLGITCSGNVVLPIDKMLSRHEILNIFDLGDVDILFSSSEFEDLLQVVEQDEIRKIEVVRLDGNDFLEILQTPSVSLPKINPEELSEILFTSGTTGVSKGVMLTQKNITANMSEYYTMNILENITCPPVALSVLPIHHTYELTIGHLGMLCRGITICINDRLENIVSNINTFKPSIILLVPTIAEAFHKKIRDGLESPENRRKVAIAVKLHKTLKRFNIDIRRKLYKSVFEKFGGNLSSIVVGGAALRLEVAETFDMLGVHIYQGYGLTECAPLVATNYPRANRLGSVGKPISRMEVKIEDQEIIVKGDCVMLGYYKNPEATSEVFTDDGWFRTGDLGHLDEDRYLYVTGRRKNLIILGNGKNIYPEELEIHVMTIDGVKDVMVYERKGKICAAIQPVDINDSSVINHIKKGLNDVNKYLPSYKRIVKYDFISREFPKTTTLKIRRKEAFEMVEQLIQNNSAEYSPPTTPMQKKIVDAFEEILGRTHLSIKDDFFDVGGDSLAAMQAAQIIGVQAQDIYTNPTVELLEMHLSSLERKSIGNDEVNVNELMSQNAYRDTHHDPKCILLTGATGFLGSHILRELNGKDVTVICLVRDNLKLNRIIEYYFPKEKYRFKHIVVEGDIEKPRLGLDDEMYAKLVDKVDMVIHTAARVNHAGHYEDFERTNVLGTKNVIDFCKDARAILHHTSTASVSGSGTVEQTSPDAKFDEFCLNIGQKYMQNVYIHSKYKAEELVLQARVEGLMANIYRIGNLTWRTYDGKFQINAHTNGFVQRCKGLLKVGVYGERIADYTIDYTQVDACAEAFVLLCFHKKVNNVYHLYNPRTCTIKTLSRKYAFRVKEVSQCDFERKLKACKSDRDVAVLGFYNSMAAVSRDVPINNDFTVNELKKLGFKWPRVGLRYLCYMNKL